MHLNSASSLMWVRGEFNKPLWVSDYLSVKDGHVSTHWVVIRCKWLICNSLSHKKYLKEIPVESLLCSKSYSGFYYLQVGALSSPPDFSWCPQAQNIYIIWGSLLSTIYTLPPSLIPLTVRYTFQTHFSGTVLTPDPLHAGKHPTLPSPLVWILPILQNPYQTVTMEKLWCS